MRLFRNPLTWIAVSVLAGMTVFNPALAAPSQEDIHRAVERTLAEFNVPGMAVSVVFEGKVYHASGYGTVEVGSEAGVDERTLFRIGSVSKAFTAAALALLADEGKLAWDDRLIDHIPEFRMHDPWVTREFTIRDMLTHRSGLPLGAGDLLIFPEGNATREEIIRAFRHLRPTSSFRSEYAYDNLLYIVAGEVVERVSGVPFEDFVEQRLLRPLGMGDCVASPTRAPADAELATPHLLMDGELETTGDGLNAVTAPAGGITCSAAGMARWMSFVLGKGVNEAGEQAVAEAEASRAVDSAPSLPLVEYTGRYRDPWYGDVHIVLEDDGRLWFRSERNEPLQGPLEHFQYDTFIARWTDRQLMADAYVTFTLSPEGKVERIRMKAVSPTTDFSYDFHDLDLQRVEDDGQGGRGAR